MRTRTDSEAAEAPVVLFLITTELSKIFLRGQLDYLGQRGFRVTLAARFDRWPPEGVDGAAQCFNLPFERDPSPLKDLRALVATCRLIRRLRPAIVHAGTPKAGLLGMIAARLTRVPTRIYSIHGLKYETHTGAARTCLIWLERLACRCASHVFADSASVRDQAIADGLGKHRAIEVVGHGSANGVDTRRFRELPDRLAARNALACPADAVVIGFVGRLTRDKGIDDLVDAFDHVHLERPRTALLLVGPFEEADAVSSATRSKADDCAAIKHHPWLEDVRLAYAAMDVCAFPSYREGLPNVPLEAQAAGVPVVGYASTGTVDAVTMGGVLVPTGDRASLARELRRFVDDLALRHQTGEAGRRWVDQNFAQAAVWAQRADRLDEALRRAPH